MELTIDTTKDNALLARKEVSGIISFEGATPKTLDVRKAVATATKADEKLVVVKIIKNHFGEKKASVTAYAYSSLDDMKKLEEVPEEPEAPAETTEAPAETTEAPAEEKKEEAEAPAEEKKEADA